MRRIAIVHHERSFFPLLLRSEIGPDLGPVWVLADHSVDAPLRRLLARSGPIVDAAELEPDEVASRLAAHGPSGIVTFADDTLRLTAALAARLGLVYHTEEQAATIANKNLQRSAFKAAGVPGPRFWTIETRLPEGDLRELAKEIVYPSVLKPAEGSGSRGMCLLSSAADLLGDHRPEGAAIIEEYLGDTSHRDLRFASYLSVESVVSRGRISHAALCGRFPLAPPFRETGNFIPAAVPDGLEPELIEITEAAIRALSITDAVCHTEIKLTDSGPKLIEVNGRLGGRPPFVLGRVCDLNLFRTACEVALGEPVVFPGPVATRGVGFWWMKQPPENARAVHAARGLERVSAAAEVDSVILDRGVGERVDWREGTAARVVTVQGRVDDLDALARTIEFISATIEVEYETEPQRPAESPSVIERAA